MHFTSIHSSFIPRLWTKYLSRGTACRCFGCFFSSILFLSYVLFANFLLVCKFLLRCKLQALGYFGTLWILKMLMICGLQARDHAHHSDLWQLPVKELKASSSGFVIVPFFVLFICSIHDVCVISISIFEACLVWEGPTRRIGHRLEGRGREDRVDNAFGTAPQLH